MSTTVLNSCIKRLEDEGYIFPTNVSLENLKYLLDVGSKPIVYLKFLYVDENSIFPFLCENGYYVLEYDNMFFNPSFENILTTVKIQPVSKFDLSIYVKPFYFPKIVSKCYSNYIKIFRKHSYILNMGTESLFINGIINRFFIKRN